MNLEETVANGDVTVYDSQGRPHTYTPRTRTVQQPVVIPEGVLIQHYNVTVRPTRGEDFNTRVTAVIQQEGKNVSVGYSFCSKNDQYKRLNGLERALQRLEQEPIMVALKEAPDRQQALEAAKAFMTFGVICGVDIPGLPSTWAEIQFY